MTMNAASIRGHYRRALDLVGETVTVRRYSGVGVSRTSEDTEVRGRVLAVAAEDFTGEIRQNNLSVIVLSEDLEANGFDLPIIPGDRVVVRDKEHMILTVADHRRIGDTVLGYELAVKG